MDLRLFVRMTPCRLCFSQGGDTYLPDGDDVKLWQEVRDAFNHMRFKFSEVSASCKQHCMAFETICCTLAFTPMLCSLGSHFVTFRAHSLCTWRFQIKRSLREQLLKPSGSTSTTPCTCGFKSSEASGNTSLNLPAAPLQILHLRFQIKRILQEPR